VQEFVENLADLNDGHNFPRDLLLSIYAAIKKERCSTTTVFSRVVDPD
jgi:Sec7-like guanine-nucleotide exchange factor